jgi:CHASE2 domain-containing sensor protein
VIPNAKQRVEPKWRKAAGIFAAVAALWLLGWLLRFTSLSNQPGPLDRLSYDLLQALHRPAGLPEFHLIEMDEKSYQALGQNPEALWDRSLHARLLRKLTKDKARGVVFDVFFGTAGSQEADEELAGAMRTNGNVGVVVDAKRWSQAGVQGVEPVFPVEPFKSAAAVSGLAAVKRDPDGVVRRHMEEAGLESLAWKTAERAGAAALAEASRLRPRWLRYYGPSGGAFPKMSYADALRQSAGFFRDKLVFVGGGPNIKKPGELADAFRTPYSRWNGERVFGVEILATNCANLLRGDWLTRVPPSLELALVLLVGIGVSVGFAWLRPLPSAALAVGAGIAIMGLAMVLDRGADLWFSWVPLVGILIPGAWLASVVIPRPADSVPAIARQELRPVSGAAASEPPPVPTVADSPQATTPMVSDHQLLRCVGRGAYGEVWLARNAIGIFHAVKIVHGRAFESADPFDREFRGISKFMPISRSHPGFVHVLHVGRNDRAGYFYYVMEAGDDESTGPQIVPETYSPKNLFKELRKRTRLGLEECIDLGIRLSDALAHLHHHQLIHRDIKPANIIFVQGTPKLADIGLVTTAAEKPNDVSYLGTKGYISPEGPGTPSSDLYGLGKVLYEAWTGMDREQFPNLPTALLGDLNPRSNRFNQILLKACETAPKDRYQSAADMNTDLSGLRAL